MPGWDPLEDDEAGFAIFVPPPPPGDTMVVTQSIGPAALQLNIPAAFTPINNISITATKAGHTLLIAKLTMAHCTLGSVISMGIYRNGAVMADGNSPHTVAIADANVALHAQQAITDAVIGDVFIIKAFDSSGTADVDANNGMLIAVTA